MRKPLALRFWLCVHDLLFAIHAPRSACMWALMRAARRVDYGNGD